jgi:hypothetical protein
MSAVFSMSSTWVSPAKRSWIRVHDLERLKRVVDRIRRTAGNPGALARAEMGASQDDERLGAGHVTRRCCRWCSSIVERIARSAAPDAQLTKEDRLLSARVRTAD